MRQHHVLGILGVALFANILIASATVAQIPPPDSSSSAPVLSDGVPQRDAMDVLKGWFGKSVDPQVSLGPPIGLQWALLPTVNYNPVSGFSIGAAISGAGMRGRDGVHYSTLSLSGSVSTTSQVQFLLRGDIFSPGENYLLKTDLRYLDTERSTWGLGRASNLQGEYPMQFKLGRVYASLYRRMTGPLYLGAGFHYDEFNNIVDERAVAGEVTPYSTYNEGLTPAKSTAVGVSLNILADTRDNLVNPSKGTLSSLVLRDYFDEMGSDEHWQELWVESRAYTRLGTSMRNVLAFWMYGWMTFGPAPYLNLPTNGWDTYGRASRGYLAGRIRGTSQLYLEGEYRRVLSANGLWGAVIFTNFLLTEDPVTGIFSQGDMAGGVGLRIKFNKRSNTNLTLDYGVGRVDQKGFFLGMTEVF